MDYVIKRIREEKNMTQEELSNKSGVNRTTIIALESGKNVNVTVKTLKAIAEVLGKEVDELFN